MEEKILRNLETLYFYNNTSDDSRRGITFYINEREKIVIKTGDIFLS